jgi:Ser/Thr protein kinase RdoA (MazF antagonist)
LYGEQKIHLRNAELFMNEQQLAAICTYFAVGSPITTLQPIQGGLLHHMWRLETSDGIYALKELNPEIMQRSGARASFRASEQIANAFASAGLSTIAALQGADGCLYEGNIYEEGPITAMLFPWLDAQSLSPAHLTPAHTTHIGSLLGKMHKQDIYIPDIEQNLSEAFSPDEWLHLIRQANSRAEGWSYTLLQASSDIFIWIEHITPSIPTLNSLLLLSHRDLDPKNVLWQGEIPYLIDWEAAGWINPTQEFLAAALDWSGLQTGSVQPTFFQAMLHGYFQAGGKLHIPALDAIMGITTNWLHWLQYNIRRATGELTADETERQSGIAEVENTLRILYQIAAQQKNWQQWIQQAYSEYRGSVK